MTGRRRLRAWTWLITCISGLINSLALLFLAQTVTHHTGNLTKLAQAGSAGDWSAAALLLGLVVCYLVGSFASGALYVPRAVIRQRRYGLMMGGLGLGLVAFTFLPQATLALYLAALSGAQNAMHITYRGILLRSTHMTGYLTDAGTALARYVKGDHEEKGRVIFLTGHVLAFLLGGVIAIALSGWGMVPCFVLTGLAYLGVGILYFLLPEGMMP